MTKRNDSYQVRNDVYNLGSSGSMTAEEFYTFLASQLVEGTNISFNLNGTLHTITINASTNSTDVINIVTNLYAPGTNVSFRLEDDMIFIDCNVDVDHKVLASETDTIPSELIHKIIGDNITVELVSEVDPTYGQQLKLKAIPEGIITEAELGIQPLSIESISEALYFDGAAPIYKQMFFMTYSTRLNTISLYCTQSGNAPQGLRFCFCDENNLVIATTAAISFVPGGWVEYPLYGANEALGITTLTLAKKEKYKFCVAMRAGAQDPKWLGIQTTPIAGTAGEIIASADLNGYSAYVGPMNLVGETLTNGSGASQAGKRIWFAGYMLE